MGTVIAFFRSWWKEIIIVGAILAIVWYHHHLTSTIAEQTLEIVSLNADKATLTLNNETLTDAIRDTNTSLTQLSQSSAQTITNMNVLKGQVSQQSQQTQTKLDEILKSPIPTTCQDTIKYLLDARKALP